jgi:hypothetical protein
MVAHDRFGNGWLSYLLDEPNLDQARIVIAISVNNGATWFLRQFSSLPGGVVAPSGTLDRTCLAVGPADGGTADEAVYVSYVDVATPQVLVAAHGVSIGGFNAAGALVPVTAGGVEVVKTGAPTIPEHARAAVGPGGELYVTWIDRGPIVGSVLFVERDQDGMYSATFTWDVDTFVDFSQSPAAPLASSPDAGPPTPMPSIAVVPTGAHAGRVAIAYELLVPNFGGVNPDHTRVVVALSDDAGYGWDTGIAVHQADTADQYLPAICADRVTGRLYLTWTDTRLDAANVETNRFSAASDGGEEWGDSVRLSDTSSVAAGGAFEFTDYGLFSGVAAHGGHVVAAWAGNEDPTGATRMDMYVRLYQQTATTSP